MKVVSSHLRHYLSPTLSSVFFLVHKQPVLKNKNLENFFFHGTWLTSLQAQKLCLKGNVSVPLVYVVCWLEYVPILYTCFIYQFLDVEYPISTGCIRSCRTWTFSHNLELLKHN